MGSQRVGHDGVTFTTLIHTYRLLTAVRVSNLEGPAQNVVICSMSGLQYQLLCHLGLKMQQVELVAFNKIQRITAQISKVLEQSHVLRKDAWLATRL